MKIGLFSAGDLGLRGLDALVTSLARSFSDCTSLMFELEAVGVVGDMAYTAGLEHTSASVDGHPRSYTLRAHRYTDLLGGRDLRCGLLGVDMPDRLPHLAAVQAVAVNRGIRRSS